MSDDQKTVQQETPGRYTTNTAPGKGPDYNRQPYYGGRADETVAQPHVEQDAGSAGISITEQEAVAHALLHLREEPDLDTSRVWIRYDGDGVIALVGSVFSEERRKKAEELARKAPEVKDVRNELTVAPHGLDYQPPHGCGDIGSGMEVLSSGGRRIGYVKELQVESFLVIRDGAPDLFVPFTACYQVEGKSIFLNIPADQVDQMNWKHPEPFTAVP